MPNSQALLVPEFDWPRKRAADTDVVPLFTNDKATRPEVALPTPAKGYSLPDAAIVVTVERTPAVAIDVPVEDTLKF